MRRAGSTCSLLCLFVLHLASPARASAQTIQGRVTDAQNGTPVSFAAVILLDRERSMLASEAADGTGAFRIALPGEGEYYLAVERLGYTEAESPLFRVGAEGEYAVDFELDPAPFELQGLEVRVDNERLVDHLRLVLGQNPNAISGFRVIQGARLAEAKAKAADNTDLLRRLYVPVSHGQNVCIGTDRMLPFRPRGSFDRHDPPEAQPILEPQCGALFLNDYRCRNELLEHIDREQIAVVVTFRGSVYLYTRDFDWTFRTPAPAC